MLKVYFTIDVEIWCDGWTDIDRKFPEAFKRYIYGPGGRDGLKTQLQVLADHGLMAVCFVESLFSGRFGRSALAEIIGVINDYGHDVQLHLHPEWADEMSSPFPKVDLRRRESLSEFSLQEQVQLIATGSAWLQEAGARAPTAFRAGNFGANADTLRALASNRIFIDSSYNASLSGPRSGIGPGDLLLHPLQIGAITEVPMTVYSDGRGLRHTQLSACSSAELEYLLWQAIESDYESFVLLSHSHETLSLNRRRRDPVVISRLRRMCSFLDRHRDVFRTSALREAPKVVEINAPLLESNLWMTAARTAEQLWRRGYR